MDVNLESVPPKVRQAFEKILLYCRRQKFTVSEFYSLVGELAFFLRQSRESLEEKSLV